MIDIEEFKPVTLNEKAFFKSFFSRYPPLHSDNTFTNMVCWNDYAKYEYYTTGDALVISSTIDDQISFRGPYGKYDIDLLYDVLRLAKTHGKDFAYQIFDEDTKLGLEKICPGIRITPDRDYYDYVYKSEVLRDLPGKKFLNIRKHINSFKKRCDFTVEEINKKSLKEVQEFLVRWCEWKQCKKNPILNFERNATVFSVDHFFDLELSGLIIRVNGNISAISMYEELNPSTVVIHFEKGLPDCEGNYKAINNQVAEIVSDKYPYINRESDLGVEGLRTAKMRYYPDHFAKVYNIRSDDISKQLKKL